MAEAYRVEVLHIVNPHLIFVESQVQKGVPVIQQIGIYGILPVCKTININGEVTVERCENWQVAANTIVREFLAEHNNRVDFVPIHIDERSTIFNDNGHQFGDIIVDYRDKTSITDHLIDLIAAVKDEEAFYKKLSSGNLELKLNSARTDEVIKAIEQYYKRQRQVSHDWEKTLRKQTSLHEESKKVRALTEENLRLLELNSQAENDPTPLKLIKLKERDFNLCKDADLVSVGRASRRSRTLSNSSKTHEDKPQKQYHKLKEFLAKYSKQKDNFDTKDVSTPQKDKNIIKENIQNKDLEKSQNYVLEIVNSNGEFSDETTFDTSSGNNGNGFSETPDKIHGHINFKKIKDTDYKKAAVIKAEKSKMSPKQRSVVFLPDMEMNNTNLKSLIPITISEDSPNNYAHTVEEFNDTTSQDGENSTAYNNHVENVKRSDGKDAGKTRDEKVVNKPIGKTTEHISNTGKRLSSLVLESKLQAFKNSKSDSNSNSSRSDLSGNAIKIEGNTEVKTNLETSNTLKNPHTEIKSSPAKGNKISASTLHKKLQALLDQEKNKSSSTSDSSITSADQLEKSGRSEPVPAEIQATPANVNQLSDKIKRNVNPFRNLDGSKSVFVEKLISPTLMVHTKNNNMILPQAELRDIPFKVDIRMALVGMRIAKPKRLQTVTWPYILRGHSMFIISAAKHGKTMGYIPAVCNLVSYSSLKIEGVGPICIIACATALSVSLIETFCKRFLGKDEHIVSVFPGVDRTKTLTALLNGCSILISTAPALVDLLETDLGVDLRRLSTLVFDDCERLSQVYTSDIAKINLHVKAMLKNRADKALNVQYIVASRQWCDFMTPLAKKAPDTIIAIGASQESVLYSKTKTSVNLVKTGANKINMVMDFLDEIDRSKRLVIVCREDQEVDLLDKTLTFHKHIVFSCNSTMDLHELCKLNELWAKYQEPILGPILICCDGNLVHLNISDANYLIHFSMPALFSTFCKRFLVLNENYPSIFEPQKEDVKIKILLDETNVEQLPRILDFVKRCTKDTLPDLDNVLRDVLEAKDLKKAQSLNTICNNLLMLGECVDMWNCTDRHTVFKEFDESKDWMPKQGLITFKILHYHSAVTYSARVLSKITKSGVVKLPNNYHTLSLKMGMYYSKEANRKLHGVPKLGDVCAVALKLNFFERCRVIKVFPGEAKDSFGVLINLIDTETDTIVSDVQLFYLPNHLKAIETYAVKVRLANIQPKDRDVTFSLTAKDCLQKVTDSDSENGVYIRGQVAMTLGNTIFVDTAEACVDLSSLGETVVKRDFKKDLLERHAEPNPQHIEKLKKICGSINIFEINEPKLEVKVKKNPKWAHLDKDDISTVIFAAIVDAGTIFVRLEKFQKIINLLLQDIQEYVQKTPEIKKQEICAGNIVLAEFPDDGTYERARIEEILNDNVVKCFFVDGGDWRSVDVNKLRPITNNFIDRIPFQAIECRLVGVKPPGNTGTWPEFSTNWLVDNCFEDKEGNQKYLFAKYFTKETATLTGGHKYGVLIIDTYSEEDIVINKMMIDLNLAKMIVDEEDYLNESLDIKRVKGSDNSSEISDENETEQNNSLKCRDTAAVKDLIPFGSTDKNNSKSNEIPPHILFGKPIRSVPLVNSDNESDLSDKWDVNFDDEMMDAFAKPLKAAVTENDKHATKATSQEVDLSKTKSIEISEINESTNESVVAVKDEDTVSITDSTILRQENDTKKSQVSLDSDDTEINDKRTQALDIFRRKMSQNDITNKTDENENLKESIHDSTLDSDDISAVDVSLKNASNTETEQARKPKLVWRQNKNSVTIKINIIGVESYNLKISERNIKFDTWHNDTKYEFDLELYGVVVAQKCVHSNKGQYIQVKLIKMMSRNWLSLTKNVSIKKWIVYDVDAIESSSDDEDDDDGDVARKAIKHNHEAVHSSSDDDDFEDDLNFTYKRY